MQWFDAVPMSKITNQLYLGGYAQAAMLSQQNDKGITFVLNVSTEPPYPENKNIVYKHVPFQDGHSIPPLQFKTSMELLKFYHNAGAKILIHCAAGISRSPVITASFMHYMGIMDINQALDLIKSRRPIVNPAVVVLNSARRMLHAWPYDGSLVSEPDHLALVEVVMEELVLNDAVVGHPNLECPVRRMMLEPNFMPNAPRHAVQCICARIIIPE